MATILLNTAKAHHPYASLYLCLADKKLPEEGFYPQGVEVVSAAELDIYDFDDFAFRYDIMEFNTAVKPFMFRKLLEAGHDAVLYFDPDIEVFSELRGVLDPLASGASFVLTPHICQPEEGEHYPGDIGVMQAGIYNLGFLGVSACPETDALLHWWSRRLRYQCVNNQPGGIFVDQKFMDLIPAYAGKARVLRDTNLNVAYWNLQQRELARGVDNTWLIDGAPLGFFHYSGFNPRNLKQLSKHTAAFRGAEMPAALIELCTAYAEKLIALGHGTVPAGLYAYGRFASGTPVTDVIRQMYRDRHVLWCSGNPFETYEEYLHLPTPGTWTGSRAFVVTNLMLDLWKRDVGLQIAFNLQTPTGVEGFCRWYCSHALDRVADPRLIEPVASRIGAGTEPLRPIPPATSDASVSVIGYLSTASGVGEVGRQTLRTLRQAGIAADGVDVSLNVHSPRNDSSVAAHFVSSAQGRAQILNVNADQLPLVMEHLGPTSRADSYRISIPFWELAEFPNEWLQNFSNVDEIWAPTKFIQSALVRRLGGKPVVHMPIALDFRHQGASREATRDRHNIPRDNFLFFFSFDFLSFIQRKNPRAVLEAFRLAFRSAQKVSSPSDQGCHDQRVGMVIKTINADLAPEHSEALRDMLRSDGDVHLIEDSLGRQEMLDLIAACDAVISLHRSEGLGLLVAEAMALGKPVVATDYSATTELLSPATGYPVDFKLIEVKEGEYPFPASQVWADPDVSHAAWQMRRLVADEVGRQGRVAAARALLARTYSAAEVGRRQLARLNYLGLGSK